MQLGSGTYQETASYDNALRVLDSKLTSISGGTVLFEASRSFDAVGNVVSAGTTLPAGTDYQAFCYDTQNRLTWAGSTGTPPCGATLTAGTLSAAAYTRSFSYDALDRLTAGTPGSYTYGDSAHLHAVTSASFAGTQNDSASYDAAGNMTCRTRSSTLTCAGTPTGAQLSEDNEGRLAAWQDAPSSPTSTDRFLYDGEGTRVAQVATSSGTTTTTVYVGQLEESATTGSTMTTHPLRTAQPHVVERWPTSQRLGKRSRPRQ